MCILCAWLSIGEKETAWLDKKSDSVRLEKQLPLREKLVLCLGKLSDMSDVGIESDSALPHLKRLVLKFQDKSIAVTDVFLDTRIGLFGSGAGLENTKRSIKQFLK